MKFGKRDYLGQEQDEVKKTISRAFYVALFIVFAYIIVFAMIGFIKQYY